MNRELLEAFCRLSPKEWEADCNEWAWFTTPTGGVLRAFLDDDSASARAIVFLWDYLEGQGLSVTVAGGGVVGGAYALCRPAHCSTGGVQHNGATRIEALVRACISYWEAR